MTFFSFRTLNLEGLDWADYLDAELHGVLVGGKNLQLGVPLSKDSQLFLRVVAYPN